MSLQPIEKLELEFIIEKRYGEIVREEWKPATDIAMTEKINELIEVVNEQSKEIRRIKNEINYITSNSPLKSAKWRII